MCQVCPEKPEGSNNTVIEQNETLNSRAAQQEMTTEQNQTNNDQMIVELKKSLSEHDKTAEELKEKLMSQNLKTVEQPDMSSQNITVQPSTAPQSKCLSIAKSPAKGFIFFGGVALFSSICFILRALAGLCNPMPGRYPPYHNFGK